MHSPLTTLSHKDLLEADRDYEMAAQAANLVYVRDDRPGIRRTKKGKGFSYSLENCLVKEESVLRRIKRLAIPPAWTGVWICELENGHIQATGFDMRKRKQYRYHSLWHVLRSETKFHRLYEFGRTLPCLRTKLEQDLNLKSLRQDKVVATVVALMERTYIRIGNSSYEKSNGSYGLTTLKDKHVSIRGEEMQFCFVGKKGIRHKIKLRNRRLAKTLSQCRDIPGKELFQYYDEQGEIKLVESGMVNNYIKEACGMDFTAKDFRTWAGSIHALEAFRTVEAATTAAEKKKNISTVLEMVGHKLGNTPAVCRKYYVHPVLLIMYEDDALGYYLRQLDKTEETSEDGIYTHTENVLMKILKKSMQNTAGFRVLRPEAVPFQNEG